MNRLKKLSFSSNRKRNKVVMEVLTLLYTVIFALLSCNV
jgi:hypothetical protein